MCTFSTTLTTGSYLHSLANGCVHTGTWCSSTSACWAFRSTGKRANSCQRRGSVFSAWSWNQRARLTQERAQSELNCFKTLSGRMAVPLKLFQRLLGHMAAAAVTVLLGLLHMRPLQHWLHGRIPRWAWKRGTQRVQITPACRKNFSQKVGQISRSFGQECPWSRGHRLVSHVQWARSIRGLECNTEAPARLCAKVPTTPFRDQVVNLQALPLEEADPALALLCPVRALRQYRIHSSRKALCYRLSFALSFI